jgi:hypothetical protein
MQGGFRTQVIPASIVGGPEELDALAETREARSLAHARIRNQNAEGTRLRAKGVI